MIRKNTWLKYMTKKIKIILLVIGILFIGGCVYSIFKVYTPNPVITNSISRTIGVYVDEEPKNPNNLKQINIANITVAKNGNLTLNILQPDNVQITQLQQAIATIASRDGLKLVGESKEIINGQSALVMKDFPISKTADSYPLAVATTLTNEFGFKSKLEAETNTLIPTVSSTTIPADQITIGTGTQGQYGSDLRIGVGYVRREDYLDENKVSHTGRVAGLWLYVKDHSEQNKVMMNVFIGQKFTIAEYAVTVLNIEGGSGAVTLQFEPTKK